MEEDLEKRLDSLEKKCSEIEKKYDELIETFIYKSLVDIFDGSYYRVNDVIQYVKDGKYIITIYENSDGDKSLIMNSTYFTPIFNKLNIDSNDFSAICIKIIKERFLIDVVYGFLDEYFLDTVNK